MSEAAGSSGTPLVKKLGLKPGMRVRLFEAPDGYWTLLGDRPSGLGVEELGADDDGDADFSHLFASTVDGLRERFAAARSGMTVDGMVWASWPKKSSGVESEIGRAEVMREGKEAGLVDVKVCAVDRTWSGLKFVIPVAVRESPG